WSATRAKGSTCRCGGWTRATRTGRSTARTSRRRRRAAASSSSTRSPPTSSGPSSSTRRSPPTRTATRSAGGSTTTPTTPAGNQRMSTIGASGGYTDLQGGRYVYQYDGTFSDRFGPDRKLGLVIGGTYDWNGRGIDDIEPGVGVSPLPDGSSISTFNGIDYR